MISYFIDTSFALALASPKDALHSKAKRVAGEIKSGDIELVTSQAVLLEIGNSLSKSGLRAFCIKFLEDLDADPHTTIISLSDELFERAFEMFSNRDDKEWGLVDCISFIVMHDYGIVLALTGDEHFVQAGFRALLRED